MSREYETYETKFLQLRYSEPAIQTRVQQMIKDGYEAIGDRTQQVSETRFIVIPDTGTLKQIESEIIRNLMSRQSTQEVCSHLGISKATLWRKFRLPSN